MAKAAKILCERCESKLAAGSPSCVRCGYPTRWASHEERTRWELSQWKTAERSQRGEAAAPTADSSRRRVLPRPFARRATPEPDWHLSLVPTPSAPASELVTMPAPKPLRSKPQPDPAPTSGVKPATRPVAPDVTIELEPAAAPPEPKIEAKPADADPAGDTPRTILAMRLLNARVAELNNRIQKLERELAESRRERSLTN